MNLHAFWTRFDVLMSSFPCSAGSVVDRRVTIDSVCGFAKKKTTIATTTSISLS